MIENIRRALDRHLATMPPPVAVAWPNTGFDPGGAYIRPTLLPNQPSQSELGREARNVHEGIYQMDVFTPAGHGAGPAENIASALVQHYRRGTDVTYNGLTVRCEMAGLSNGPQEPDWYRLIVQVDYRSYIEN